MNISITTCGLLAAAAVVSLAAISTIGQYNTNGSSLGVAISSDDNTAFVADNNRTLQVIDISDPANPVLLGSYDMGGNAQKIALSSDESKAFIPSLAQGLVIIDITTPSSPSFLGQYNSTGDAYGIALSGDNNTAFVAYGSRGLRMVDVSDASSPTLIGSYDTSGDSRAVALSADGNTAYVADYGQGLKVIDVSNPASPFLIGSYDTDGDAHAVVLSRDGTRAYVGDRVQGLKIFDVSTPSNPALLGGYKRSGNFASYDVSVSMDPAVVFFAYGQRGALAVDVSDPSNPFSLEEFSIPGSGNSVARQIAVTRDQSVACVAHSDRGIYTLDFSDYASSDLVAHWTFDDLAGVTAYDSSVYDHHGTLVNMAPGSWTTGKHAGALDFDGINDYVDGTNGSPLDITSSITVAAWIRQYGAGSETSTSIVSKWNNTSGQRGWRLIFNEDTDRVSFVKREADDSGDETSGWSGYVPSDSWHHVAGVFDDDNNIVYVYIDGIESNRVTGVGDGMNSTFRNVVVGSQYVSGSPGSSGSFNGGIDDVRIYNRALSAGEIAALAGNNGLVAHWRLDETSGIAAYDSSGHGHTGTLTDMDPDTAWLTGNCGGGLAFDGFNDRVLVNDVDELDDTGKLTFAYWCYPYTLDGRPRAPICKRQHWTTEYSWSSFFYTGDRMFIDIAGNDNRFSTNTVFTENRWYHIAVVFDGTLAAGERVKVYVNGVLDKTAYESSTAIPNTSSPVVLGLLNGNTTGWYHGILDDVRVYRAALSESEIHNIMQCSELVAHWMLDDGSGQTAADSSGGGHHATLGSSINPDANDPAWVEGICGTALEFDGTNDFADAGASMSQLADFTVCAWVKPYVIESDRQVVSKGYDGTNTQWEMKTTSSSGRVSFRTWRTATGHVGVESIQTLAADAWTHLTGTFDGTTWKIYFNGILDNSADDEAPVETAQRLLIGAVDANGNPIQIWNGVIDDVRIYNRALSATEVADLPQCPGAATVRVIRWREVRK